MAKTTTIQADFTSGEISPLLSARVDLSAYDKAVKTLKNAVVLPHGAAKRRPGTLFVGEVHDSSRPVKLIPLTLSSTESGICVFNGGVIQFVSNGAFVLDGGVRYSVPNPYADEDLADVNYAQYGNILALVHPKYKPKIMQASFITGVVISDVEFEYRAVTDYWYESKYLRFKIISGGTPFVSGDQFVITTNAQGGGTAVGSRQNVGNGNVVNVVELSNPKEQWTVSAISSTEYSVTGSMSGEHPRGTLGQWYTNEICSFTITPGTIPFAINDRFQMNTFAGGAPVILTGSIVGSGEVVEIMSLNDTPPTTWTVKCVSSSENRQEWVVSGIVDGVLVYPTVTWGPGDYPSAVSFYEQRVFAAGSPSHPQTIWASSNSDFRKFTLGPLDSDALSFTIASNKFDELIHLEVGRYLIPLSYSSEFSMTGASGGITPSAVRIRSETSHGSARVRPIRIGQEILFVQRDKKKLRAISYSVAQDVNVAPDVTIFSEHITGSGIKDMAFSQDPDYMAWLVKEDGELLSLTHLRDQEVTAWSRHTTDGLFENVSVLAEPTADNPYLVVKRIINGSAKRYIEIIDYVKGAQTDSAVIFNSYQTTSVSGLGHLEGKTVQIVADGLVQVPKVVSGGTVSLTQPAFKVEVGLGYKTTIELLNPEPRIGGETAQGKVVSIKNIVLRLKDTVGCKVNGADIPFRTTGDPTDVATPLFTGDKRVSHVGWSDSENIIIEQDMPKPFTLLGVIFNLVINS